MQRLTNTTGYDGEASISSDGKRIILPQEGMVTLIYG